MTRTTPRTVVLGRATLADLPAQVERPTYDAARLTPGVVHLGVGAFHRAHAAVYLDRVAGLGASRDWGVTGIGLRSNSHRAELVRQDLLYTVLELSAGAPRARVVGVLQDYHPAGSADALGALLDPRTRLVTLTLTAPSYAADGPVNPAFGLLARALDARRRAGIAPFTVLSCDNLPGNGHAARRCVVAAAEELDPALARWVEAHVAFPSSMADRITPPTSEEHRRLLRREHGIHDRAPVVTEPFSDWVVEDVFAAGRPPLEEVGVRMVPDAAPYVAAKMRTLNAAHVALGFLGEHTLHPTTDAAMADPLLGATVERLLRDEVAPLLDPVPGLDVTAYVGDVLDRLRNPAIADPLSRLRRRGSVRMRNYVLPSLERAVTTGRPHRLLTDVVAAWVDHLRATAVRVEAGEVRASEVASDLADPALPGLLRPALRAADDVRPFLAAAPGFDVVRESMPFVRALQRTLAEQEEQGHAAAAS